MPNKEGPAVPAAVCLYVPALPLPACIHLPSLHAIFILVRSSEFFFQLDCCPSAKKKKHEESRDHLKKKSHRSGWPRIAFAARVYHKGGMRVPMHARLVEPLQQRDDAARDKVSLHIVRAEDPPSARPRVAIQVSLLGYFLLFLLEDGDPSGKKSVDRTRPRLPRYWPRGVWSTAMRAPTTGPCGREPSCFPGHLVPKTSAGFR